MDTSYNDDHRYQYLAGVLILTVISVTVVWIRMYVRLFRIGAAGSDDWIMFAASLLCLLTNGFLMQCYKLGLGEHLEFLSNTQRQQFFEFFWMVTATNMFALYFMRLSISLTFLRIVPISRKYLRACVWVTIAGMTASAVHITIIYFIQCIPIQKVWITDLSGQCISSTAYQSGPWIYQGFSIITDIIITAIAIHLFANVHARLGMRITIVLLCSMAVFTCICAMIKTIFLKTVFDSNPDKTWSLAPLGIFSALELTIGMICGSLPCLRPLFQQGEYDSRDSRDNLIKSWYRKNSRNTEQYNTNRNRNVRDSVLPSMAEIYRNVTYDVNTSPESDINQMNTSTSRQNLILPIQSNCTRHPN